MPILTNERAPERGRRSWIPALIAGVPLLLLAAIFLWALLVPLDEPLIVPMGGDAGAILVGENAQAPPGVPGLRPPWQAFVYKRKVHSGEMMEVHGICLGYRNWYLMQWRR